VASIKFRIYPSASATVAGIADEAAARAAEATRRKAQANIKAAGRVHTGAMGGNMTVHKVSSSNNEARYKVTPGGTGYAKYQEFGTRAHGPVRAKRLVFQIRGKGPVIFAKWVRGVTAAHFMRDAVQAVKASDYAR
jgi:HK97 gp10 family phage protein